MSVENLVFGAGYCKPVISEVCLLLEALKQKVTDNKSLFLSHKAESSTKKKKNDVGVVPRSAGCSLFVNKQLNAK